MNIVNTSYTVATLVDMFDRKDLTINRNYQRSDEVWPAFARSLLIETAILNFPMPKLTIRQRTDVKELKTYMEIVDGQQRTKALVDYIHGDFALVGLETQELNGCTIHQLPEPHLQRLASYAIGADLLVGASDGEVIEVFRRMNSYTAPLNPEEQRHATYQGAFKWMIFDLRRQCEGPFAEMGVFAQKAFVRMQDAKLLTEICHAALNFIKTTNKKHLDNLYATYNKALPEVDLRTYILAAVEFLNTIDALKESPLVKPYNFYALVLAVMALRGQTILAVEVEAKFGKLELAPVAEITPQIFRLHEALEWPEAALDDLERFVSAAQEKTNTAENRQTRFEVFCRVLSNTLP